MYSYVNYAYNHMLLSFRFILFIDLSCDILLYKIGMTNKKLHRGCYIKITSSEIWLDHTCLGNQGSIEAKLV